MILNVKSCRYIQKSFFNSNYASICKVHRKIYARLYPTLVVNADGSTFITRYHEPRQIIKLPVDVTSLTEEEKQLRVLRMKPKLTITQQDFVKKRISPMKYVNIMKN